MATPAPDDLPIFTHWLTFLTWLLLHTEKFPRKVRFTLSNRIDNLALDIVEDLVTARYTRDKQAVLRQANLRLEKLRILLRVSHDLGHLAPGSYEHAMRTLLDVGTMLGEDRRRVPGVPACRMEERFPTVAATQPALLAQHYSAAGRTEAAVDAWQRAGKHALAQSASVEAMTHCAQGLAALQDWPQAAARWQPELALSIDLGTASAAAKGYAAPGVEQAYDRARTLCQHLDAPQHVCQVLAGLRGFYQVRALYQTAQSLAEQCLAIAQRL